MKRAVIVLGIVLISGYLLVTNRHVIVISFMSSGEPPPLLERVQEASDASWFDDYFLIQKIDRDTYAIGEPLYWQQNFSYLIVGTERAVLFDAGPGFRDIRAAAESLTNLPITFVPSHFHFDHVGNTVTFDDVAVVDLPYLRDRAADNNLTLTWEEHVGTAEGLAAPTLKVNKWLPVGSSIDLGGRSLRVVYTPGHSTDSISLLDEASRAMFSGDFMYPGPLYAFLPNSGMGDYLAATERVIEAQPRALLGAHREAAPGVPRLGLQDVEDLRAALVSIRDGELSGTGIYPREYPVNDRVMMLAEPAWLQNWERSDTGSAQ